MQVYSPIASAVMFAISRSPLLLTVLLLGETQWRDSEEIGAVQVRSRVPPSLTVVSPVITGRPKPIETAMFN